MLPGVYQAKKKDNTIYFRSSITYSGKHISLGSFDTEEKAHEAYLYAGRLLAGKEITLTSYKKENPVLSFSKWVSLINFRDNGIYIKTPIYLFQKYFHYYFSRFILLLYPHHKPPRRTSFCCRLRNAGEHFIPLWH